MVRAVLKNSWLFTYSNCLVNLPEATQQRSVANLQKLATGCQLVVN